jgi:hypothetical protein
LVERENQGTDLGASPFGITVSNGEIHVKTVITFMQFFAASIQRIDRINILVQRENYGQ